MRLRLVTYNIHKCIGGIDRRYQPERTIATIAHYRPDLALLQEVDAGAKRSLGDKQSELLADGLGLRHRAWFPNVMLRSGGAYGNAVLSRFVCRRVANIDLTLPGKKARSVLHAEVRARGPSGRTRTIHVFNMHLGLREQERRIQLDRFFASEPFARLHARTPIVVGGDLNDVYGSLGNKRLLPAGFRPMPRAPRTFPAFAPLRALDAVFVRGDLQIRRVARGQVAIARRASDHLPLIVDLELALS